MEDCLANPGAAGMVLDIYAGFSRVESVRSEPSKVVECCAGVNLK